MAQAGYKPQDYSTSTATGTSAGMSGSTGTDLKDKAAEQMDRMGHQMERMAHQASEKADQMSENMRVVANNLDSALRRSIRDQPMTTLAMAVAAGFVLGAIWKS